MTTNTLEIVRAEIVRLHDFFVEWMTGSIDQTNENFGRFIDYMGEGFYIVAPSGQLTDRERLSQMLYKTYGQRIGLRIWIENVQIQQYWEDIIIATYEEWQQATTDSHSTVRLSTVVFRREQQRFIWYCVHETWLPIANPKDE